LSAPVLAFNAKILASALALSNSKLLSLIVADAVKVFNEPVLTLNAAIDACCDPELTFKLSMLALTELVYVFRFHKLALTDVV